VVVVVVVVCPFPPLHQSTPSSSNARGWAFLSFAFLLGYIPAD